MEKLEKVFEDIKRSNYFFAWEDILVGDKAFSYWSKILDGTMCDSDYDYMADILHKGDLPYVIITEYVDEVFRKLQYFSEDYFIIKNKIAKAYLTRRLLEDKKNINKVLAGKLSRAVDLKKNLINAHLVWMEKFIDTVISDKTPPELDFRLCTVGAWLQQEQNVEEYKPIEQIHRKLHIMAQSALRMYEREDYAHFLLLYLDILNTSYQIRELIINVYLAKRFTSIYKDHLTNQPNYLQLQLDLQTSHKDKIIVMLNIKEFSALNLLYGHTVGDILIKDVVAYLLSLERVEKVYRIYGDVFCVIFSQNDREYMIKRFKNDLESHEYHVKDKRLLLSFYGSFSYVSKHTLEYCEYGLISSKKYVGTFVDATVIDENIVKQYGYKMTLSQKLKMAFLDDRFVCFYQPVMDKKSQKICRYEVLMRVQMQDGSYMLPGEFLPVLTEMYIYPEVTKVIIQKSFEFFKDKRYEFSVNLSFADIVNPETEAFISAIIKQYPKTAQRCSFELLEQETISAELEVLNFFELLKKHKVQISIDDFGSGFSNYDTIFKFDVDSIKIDGTITESLLISKKSRVLLDSIISVAKEMGAKIIVEYVSSKELYDYLYNLDIDMLQGFYIGKPSAKLLTE